MGRTEARSEVTGVVWKILKNVGDSVAADDVVLLIESMKIPVVCEEDGRVQEMFVKEGDCVTEVQTVAVLETA